MRFGQESIVTVKVIFWTLWLPLVFPADDTYCSRNYVHPLQLLFHILVAKQLTTSM